MSAPRLSVIIASYRWPEALELSLASALSQSEADIEVLVVEDGEDAASRDVVERAGDSRVRWMALDPPCGGQSGPNALGIERAHAPLVAYLGHDDIWHPEHASSLLEVLDSGVDMAHATTLMLSDWTEPEQTGIAGASAWTIDTFVPPSSLGHVRSGPRIAQWTPPAHDGRPIDYRFLADCQSLGARVGSTGRATVVKFPAAWRKDSYVTRDVTPQRDAVAALAQDLEAVSERVAQSLAAGVQGEWPAPPLYPPGVIADYTRRSKGLPALNHPTHRWTIDTVPPGANWHGHESDSLGAFSWTHGDKRAWVRVDRPQAAELTVRITLAHVVAEWQLDKLVLDVDGTEVELQRSASDPGLVLIGRLANTGASTAVEIGLTCPGVRPAETDPSSHDTRLLGVAVREIEVLS